MILVSNGVRAQVPRIAEARSKLEGLKAAATIDRMFAEKQSKAKGS
jgi:hypothetical protein